VSRTDIEEEGGVRGVDLPSWLLLKEVLELSNPLSVLDMTRTFSSCQYEMYQSKI
jgi:hypothetical protein